MVNNLPLKLVLLIFDIVSFIVVKELGNAGDKFVIYTVHVARCGYDGIHVAVAVLYTLLYLWMFCQLSHK